MSNSTDDGSEKTAAYLMLGSGVGAFAGGVIGAISAYCFSGRNKKKVRKQ